jgi:hypothetical protein
MMNTGFMRIPLLLAIVLFSCVALQTAQAAKETWLDALDIRAVRQDWGTAQRSRSVMDNPLTVAGRRFARGVGTHANSRFVLPIAGYTRFTAFVGVDDEMAGHPGSVEFMVVGDRKLLWRSGMMRVGAPAKPVEVDLTGVKTLELVVTDAGDGIDSDHADWCDAKLLGAGGTAGPPAVFLSSPALEPAMARPARTALRLDRSLGSRPLRVGGREFSTGLGTQAGSDILYTSLNGRYARFDAWIGVDTETAGEGSARFRVLADGQQRTVSPVMRRGAPAVRVSIPVAGARELRLVVDAVGGTGADVHADWGDAVLIGGGQERKTQRAARYAVRSPALRVELTDAGEIAAVVVPGRKPLRRGMTGGTYLAGCRVEGRVETSALPGGGREFRKRLLDPVSGARCALIERFRPTQSSVRWEMEIRGAGGAWSTAIETRLRWPNAARARFWTAWADSRHSWATGWSDPLTPAPFNAMRLRYGAPPYREDDPRLGYVPFLYDIFCIPLATVLEEQSGLGFSLAASPEDDLLEMAMETDEVGNIVLRRGNYRISARRPVRFAMDLVPHAADWRSGLAWMTARYPAFFDPPNPKAGEIAGCGAYSTWQGDLDVAKMRRMAFRVNWQASFEFPYMGMFLPPVASDDEEWVNFRRVKTSLRKLNDYDQRMRALGFYVLSYFNMTEFGAYLRWPPPPRRAQPDADLWKDPNDFLYTRLAGAVLKTRQGQPFWSWEGSVAMDPGEPVYRKFLLEQARRHVERVPAAAGICIDRMDWLRLYNLQRDDGVCWFEGQPAHSLLMSWKDIMGRLGPLMHAAGKAVFVNNHVKRLETLRHADGIYDEFGYHPASLNLCALLGVRKPVIAWTASPDDLKPDPDAFFQRYLYLGVFPTAPYPGNDHSINPDAWAERYYMDYGPLLDTLRGKRWVLRPRAVTVAGGTARANLFAVPGGFVVPVTFGGGAKTARVVVRGAFSTGAFTGEALHPGADKPVPLKAAVLRDGLRMEVPLRRGCAMVRIRTARPRGR